MTAAEEAEIEASIASDTPVPATLVKKLLGTYRALHTKHTVELGWQASTRAHHARIEDAVRRFRNALDQMREELTARESEMNEAVEDLRKVTR